jgi:hypothetical protein
MGRREKEKEMDTQTESKPVAIVVETPIQAENPMQERHCGEVNECVEMTAEAVFTALRLEAGGEAGLVFVP